jgi:hypothetical protein
MIYTGTVNAIRLTHGTHQAEVREGGRPMHAQTDVPPSLDSTTR